MREATKHKQMTEKPAGKVLAMKRGGTEQGPFGDQTVNPDLTLHIKQGPQVIAALSFSVDARGGIRTRTGRSPRDFKSLASTDSATRASVCLLKC